MVTPFTDVDHGDNVGNDNLMMKDMNKDMSNIDLNDVDDDDAPLITPNSNFK